MKVYERAVSGRTGEGIEDTTSTVSQKEGLAEINSCMIGDLRNKVSRMSSIRNGTDYHIVYRDGSVVQLTLVDAPAPEQTEAAPVERTAVIQRSTAGGYTLGRVVNVKGKDYVLAVLTPADRPVHVGAPKDWKPTAYVTYWSVCNGERFGATRTAGPTAKPGTVGHTLFHNALDHANGNAA